MATIKSFGPVPSERQFAWHQMEFYGFIHFTINTFTDREWGYGEEGPEMFNPTELDARQWAKVARDAGMKGLILTCKHHDGFCLWPSAYTEHSVKNSPWKNGQGDLVKEVSDACREFGLKFGVYLSPWDRNHAEYGRPAYIEYYRNQMRELLTNYGPVYEVWLDGANGGDGYYGGANEERRIERSTYYDWPNTLKIVRELQPQAVVFSDGGPDIRWVGNESGEASETNWCTLNAKGRYPGYGPEGYNPKEDLGIGHENGTHWLPAEVDVSIRPGWFYHKSEDGSVRTSVNLLDLYLQSVGRGANFLLNLPPDRRGLIHEIDVANLMGFAKLRDGMLENKVISLQNNGSPLAVTKDNGVYIIEIPCQAGAEYNLVKITEMIQFGQRVKAWTLEYRSDGAWEKLVSGTTIGCQRLMTFPKITVNGLRLRVTASLAEPVIGEIALYDSPVIVKEPVIERDLSGMVSIDRGNGVNIRFTTDGSEVTGESPFYLEPFECKNGGVVQAAIFESDNPGALITGNFQVRKLFGYAKNKWGIASCSSDQAGRGEGATQCINPAPDTQWVSNPDQPGHPHYVAIDMGEEKEIAAFGYLPCQSGLWGRVNRASFAVSSDGETWETVVSEAVFDNIGANPIMQYIKLDTPVKARYFKFMTLSSINDSPHGSAAELKAFPPGIV